MYNHILLHQSFCLWLCGYLCAHNQSFKSYFIGFLNLLCEVFAWFSDAVVTLPCDAIALCMLYSYFWLVLHRHNSWHAGHQKTRAVFMSVAYAYNSLFWQLDFWAVVLWGNFSYPNSNNRKTILPLFYPNPMQFISITRTFLDGYV